VPHLATLIGTRTTTVEVSGVPFVESIGGFFATKLTSVKVPPKEFLFGSLGILTPEQLNVLGEWAVKQYEQGFCVTQQRYSLRPALMSVFNGYMQMYYDWILTSGKTMSHLNFVPTFMNMVIKKWAINNAQNIIVERAEDTDPYDAKPYEYNKNMPKDIFNSKSQQMEPIMVWDQKTPLHKQREIDYDTIDALQEKYKGENMVRQANPSAYLAPNPLSNSYYEEDADGPIAYPGSSPSSSSSSSYRNRIPSSRGMRPPSWPALAKGWKPMRRSQMQRDDDSLRGTAADQGY
jgi:hypothetical protein